MRAPFLRYDKLEYMLSHIGLAPSRADTTHIHFDIAEDFSKYVMGPQMTTELA